MAKNHFYWGIKKTVAMPQNAWNKLTGILGGVPDVSAILDDQGNIITPAIPGSSPYLLGTSDQRQNTLQVRVNIAGDGVIYEANFDDTNLSFEIIRQKLVNAGNVADNTVTFTTSQQTFSVRPSAIVAYRINGTILFRATIFGRLNDTQIITWPQSQVECTAYLSANSLEWDG